LKVVTHPILDLGGISEVAKFPVLVFIQISLFARSDSVRYRLLAVLTFIITIVPMTAIADVQTIIREYRYEYSKADNSRGETELAAFVCVRAAWW
jgi:hypothetical protein